MLDREARGINRLDGGLAQGAICMGIMQGPEPHTCCTQGSKAEGAGACLPTRLKCRSRSAPPSFPATSRSVAAAAQSLLCGLGLACMPPAGERLKHERERVGAPAS